MTRFLKGGGCGCGTKRALYAMRLNTRQIRWRYVHTSSRPACLSQELHISSPPTHFLSQELHTLQAPACFSQELQSFSRPAHFFTTRMLVTGIADCTQMTRLHTLFARSKRKATRALVLTARMPADDQATHSFRALYALRERRRDTRTLSRALFLTHSFSRLACLRWHMAISF
jgi:hypothetical protein